MKNLILTLAFLLSFTTSFSQVSVTATSNDSAVFCGLCTQITAVGVQPNYSETFTFESGWPFGWDIPASGMLSNPCGSGPSGTYAWMGPATPAPRTLETDGFNTACGGIVCFDFHMAPPGAPAPCEDPDLPGEGVYFEYSTDGGFSWTTIFYFDPTAYGAFSYDGWNTFCYAIPPPAETTNTMFRWHQEEASGNCCDHWGIDNFTLTIGDCGYYYDWQHIPGYPDNDTVTVCPNTDTTYTVYWANGVDGITQANVSIDVYFSSVQATLSTTSPIDSCGGCVQINGTIINPESVSYSWNWSGPNITYVNDSTILACPQDDSWYYVTLSANGCEAYDSVFVDVNMPIPDDILTVSENMCSPAVMKIENSMPGSNCQFTVMGPESTYIHNGCEPFFNTYEIAGVYDVMFTMVTTDGCVVDSLYENFFEVYQTPIASFMCSPNEGTIIENVIQFNNTTIGGEYFDWDLGDGTTSGDIHVTHEYTEVGTYDITLGVTTQWGCGDTTYGKMVIKDDIYVYVPNTFTPDGNDYNNVFKPILSRHDIYKYKLTIFNRYGEIMFVSYDSEYGWDGTYGDGGLAQDGVYIWRILVKMPDSAEIREYSGHVTLLR